MDIEHTLVTTPFIRVFSFRHGPGAHRDPDQERFDHPELIFTLADRWGVQCGRGEAIGQPGVLVLGNQGEEYRCRHFTPEPHDKILGVSFVGLTEPRNDLLSEWLASCRLPLFTTLAMPLIGDLRWYLRRLLREITIRRAGFQVKVEDLCGSMLVDVVRGQRRDRRSPRWAAGSGRRTREAVACARGHIDRHFAESMDLLTLARIAGVSPFHFSRVFKQVSGYSPYQYVLRTRLQHAATLLRTTDAPVLEIALSVGFQDGTHFARSFRRHTGVTPTLYRRGR